MNYRNMKEVLVPMNGNDDAIAEALGTIAVHLKYLGVGDAGTTMGAIEFLAVEIRKGSEAIALAIERGCGEIASAMIACSSAEVDE